MTDTYTIKSVSPAGYEETAPDVVYVEDFIRIAKENRYAIKSIVNNRTGESWEPSNK